MTKQTCTASSVHGGGRIVLSVICTLTLGSSCDLHQTDHRFIRSSGDWAHPPMKVCTINKGTTNLHSSDVSKRSSWKWQQLHRRQKTRLPLMECAAPLPRRRDHVEAHRQPFQFESQSQKQKPFTHITRPKLFRLIYLSTRYRHSIRVSLKEDLSISRMRLRMRPVGPSPGLPQQK